MHEKDEQVDKVQKEKDDLFNQLVAEREKAFHYQEAYEKLVKVLKSFDYQGCHCMLKTVPEVTKACEYIADVKIGKDRVAPV